MKNLIPKLTLLIALLFAAGNPVAAQEEFPEFDEFDTFDEPERPRVDFYQTLQEVRGELAVETLDPQTMALQAQNTTNKALRGFLRTPFMASFNDLKLEAESLAGTFKTLSSEYSPQQVAQVRKSYQKIAVSFNMLLEDIRDDFMNRKKMKVIKVDPEMYSMSLQHKLRELKDQYSQDFEKTVADVTDSEVFAAAPIAAIVALIKLSVDLGSFFANSGLQAKQAKREELDRYLMEPYRLRGWDDIPEGSYYPRDSYDGGGYGPDEYPEEDPYDPNGGYNEEDPNFGAKKKKKIEIDPFEESAKPKSSNGSKTKTKKNNGN